MPLSWNEIGNNALAFSKEWSGAVRERSESQTFWNEFFGVFGLRRRLYATFEEPVKKSSGKWGFIDVFWPTMLLAEQKSLGKDLGKAELQAFDYIQELRNSGREKEIPRYVVVSDFARIALHDLEPDSKDDEYYEFPIHEFYKHIHRFAFIPGYKRHVYLDQDPINIKAVEVLGKLHDELKDGGYSGHDLERFMVRVLFCLFAEDTGIFDRDAFLLFILNRTAEDGSDLGIRIAQMFAVLNKPKSERQKNLDEDLIDLPYVNGELFSEQLGFAAFNRKMRDALIACSRFDWSRISPAIFGSLFQSIMTPKDRRQIGAHYTSERDILKVARGLFLDQLREEFERIKQDSRTGQWRSRLERFHKKICSLKFLDPACGCGNFLIITYRELRQLELEVLQELFSTQQELRLTDAATMSKVDVDQMYGIEIQEWPAQIAEVALWLMDHQMNLRVSEVFGQLYQRLPLKKSPHIHVANALRIDWNDVLPSDQCDYVLGNPPFAGPTTRNADQKRDLRSIFGSRYASTLDYVTGWYMKAADFINGQSCRVAFVSTNSITQGDQVAPLWKSLNERGVEIDFAHKTFAWTSEARGKAHVHCVIVGFSNGYAGPKRIFHQDNNGITLTAVEVKQINPYLQDAPNTIVEATPKPMSLSLPPVLYGSKPADGGYLILDIDEIPYQDSIAMKYIRRYVGAKELLHDVQRKCIWIPDASSAPDMLDSDFLRSRIEQVRIFRNSASEDTKKATNQPYKFIRDRQPSVSYVALPSHVSANRLFFPVAHLPATDIASNAIFTAIDPDKLIFGILSSTMFVTWLRTVGGQIKSDLRFTNTVVYNTFPLPELNNKNRQLITNASSSILNARAIQTGTCLANLYEPLSMSSALLKAHAKLDKAVDKCYRKEPFKSEQDRIEYLFFSYEKIKKTLTLKNTSKTKKLL